MFKNRVLRKIFGENRDYHNGEEWSHQYNQKLQELYPSADIVRVMKSWRHSWTGYVA